MHSHETSLAQGEEDGPSPSPLTKGGLQGGVPRPSLRGAGRRPPPLYLPLRRGRRTGSHTPS
ncbi:MAG: hypothetical protein EXR54_02510 [Dehalococcoidia bacterium]|nr:hypothetical protein [Dehalococcoidia bacterium]MSQ16429.1 hypothetical protein [Dehalococcoidia bacterium]